MTPTKQRKKNLLYLIIIILMFFTIWYGHFNYKRGSDNAIEIVQPHLDSCMEDKQYYFEAWLNQL